MKKNHVVAGFYLPQIMRRPDLFGPSMRDLLGWIASGQVKLNIGGRYGLSEAHKAHEDLQGRRTTGKLVLNP
jgi:NADPH2:quinone reductase